LGFIFPKYTSHEKNHLRPNNLKDAASSFASILEETPAKLAATADKVLRLYFCQEKNILMTFLSPLRSCGATESRPLFLSSSFLIFFFSYLLLFLSSSFLIFFFSYLLLFLPSYPLTFLPFHLYFAPVELCRAGFSPSYPLIFLSLLHKGQSLLVFPYMGKSEHLIMHGHINAGRHYSCG